MFKNAGSTVDRILRNNFQKACGGIEGDEPWDTLPSDELLAYCQNNRKLKVVSSHQARPPLPRDQKIQFHPVVFLRNPIDRVGSVYSFDKRQPEDSPSLGAKFARENDLASYVRWRIGEGSEGHDAVIKNFQTIFLSGRHQDMRTAVATEEDLERAIATLHRLPAFGIVEQFDRSIEWISAYLSPYFGRINVDYDIENKSSERRGTIECRLKEIQNSLGEELYEELIDKNSLDLQLYETAQELFHEKVHQKSAA